MDLLIGLYIFCVVVSELMGAKTFHILNLGHFPLNASVAVFVVPIIYAVTNIVTEVYGRNRARSIIRTGLLTVFLIMVFSIIAVSLPSSTRFLPSEPAYDQVFEKSARIATASLMAFGLAEILDVYVFLKIRQALGQKALWLRNSVSNVISEFFDSFIFIFLAFYALDKSVADNVIFLFSLIVPYWLLKSLLGILETPFVYAGVKWLKKEDASSA